MTVLSAADAKAQLGDAEGWDVEAKSLRKSFKCDDFTHAMDFVVRVGELAEENDHHPDIDIRYDTVSLTLSTHSEGGITDKDIALAKAIEELAD